ncbi:hypothetical protein DPEC_G00183970 [Dallia pectoralis]|uniref:Uncharacterized protein n=1 Tax=Dallia pectoralis TaxID=75939 RepID=A0ACC2GAW3_DALPE|nr:hypothetical protein DPEC_G00183970 [Dallia pectoralis]
MDKDKRALALLQGCPIKALCVGSAATSGRPDRQLLALATPGERVLKSGAVKMRVQGTAGSRRVVMSSPKPLVSGKPMVLLVKLRLSIGSSTVGNTSTSTQARRTHNVAQPSLLHY